MKYKTLGMKVCCLRSNIYVRSKMLVFHIQRTLGKKVSRKYWTQGLELWMKYRAQGLKVWMKNKTKTQGLKVWMKYRT